MNKAMDIEELFDPTQYADLLFGVGCGSKNNLLFHFKQINPHFVHENCGRIFAVAYHSEYNVVCCNGIASQSYCLFFGISDYVVKFA